MNASTNHSSPTWQPETLVRGARARGRVCVHRLSRAQLPCEAIALSVAYTSAVNARGTAKCMREFSIASSTLAQYARAPSADPPPTVTVDMPAREAHDGDQCTIAGVWYTFSEYRWKLQHMQSRFYSGEVISLFGSTQCARRAAYTARVGVNDILRWLTVMITAEERTEAGSEHEDAEAATQRRKRISRQAYVPGTAPDDTEWDGYTHKDKRRESALLARARAGGNFETELDRLVGCDDEVSPGEGTPTFGSAAASHGSYA